MGLSSKLLCDPGVSCLRSSVGTTYVVRPCVQGSSRSSPSQECVRLQDRAPTDACDRELWLQLHPETEGDQSAASLNCVTDHAGACPTLKPAPRPASTKLTTLLSWSVVVVGLRPASLANSAGSGRVGKGPASPSSPSSPPGPAGAVAPAALGCLAGPAGPASPAKSCESNRTGECGRSCESTNPDHSEAVRQAWTPT